MHLTSQFLAHQMLSATRSSSQSCPPLILLICVLLRQSASEHMYRNSHPIGSKPPTMGICLDCPCNKIEKVLHLSKLPQGIQRRMNLHSWTVEELCNHGTEWLWSFL